MTSRPDRSVDSAVQRAACSQPEPRRTTAQFINSLPGSGSVPWRKLAWLSGLRMNQLARMPSRMEQRKSWVTAGGAGTGRSRLVGEMRTHNVPSGATCPAISATRSPIITADTRAGAKTEVAVRGGFSSASVLGWQSWGCDQMAWPGSCRTGDARPMWSRHFNRRHGESADAG